MRKLVHSTLLVRVYKIKMSLYRTITQYYFRRVFTLTMEKLLEKTIIIVLNVVGFVKVSTKMVQKVKNGCYTVSTVLIYSHLIYSLNLTGNNRNSFRRHINGTCDRH